MGSFDLSAQRRTAAWMPTYLFICWAAASALECGVLGLEQPVLCQGCCGEDSMWFLVGDGKCQEQAWNLKCAHRNS